MKKCRFRIGDRVDIDAGAQSLQRWVVFYTDFDKRFDTWMVWVESRGGDVHRFKERHLISRPENLALTKGDIANGNTAREILGLHKVQKAGRKKYYSVIFKRRPKK